MCEQSGGCGSAKWSAPTSVRLARSRRRHEPATLSLGRRRQIGNKEHCVSWHLVLAIEITQFSLCAFAQLLTGAQTKHTFHLVQNPPTAIGTSLRPSFAAESIPGAAVIGIEKVQNQNLRRPGGLPYLRLKTGKRPFGFRDLPTQ
jgi:hypothetical protein